MRLSDRYYSFVPTLTNISLAGLANRVETVRDRLGNVTLLAYDTRGNVTRKVDPLLNATLYT